jgi:hypothetical protein
MSYDIDLKDPVSKQVIRLDQPHFMHGGTFCLSGTTELSLNITYNYAPHFYRLIDEKEGIRFIYGKTALETLPILEKAISQLSDDVNDNYWESTEGNAKQALIQLKTMAQMRPDGIWDGD